LRAFVCVREREKEKERKREKERERERKREREREREKERGRELACLCVRVCVYESEKERETCVLVCVSVCVCVCVCVFCSYFHKILILIIFFLSGNVVSKIVINLNSSFGGKVNPNRGLYYKPFYHCKNVSLCSKLECFSLSVTNTLV
jgi:hypothetical protein